MTACTLAAGSSMTTAQTSTRPESAALRRRRRLVLFILLSSLGTGRAVQGGPFWRGPSWGFCEACRSLTLKQSDLVAHLCQLSCSRKTISCGSAFCDCACLYTARHDHLADCITLLHSLKQCLVYSYHITLYHDMSCHTCKPRTSQERFAVLECKKNMHSSTLYGITRKTDACALGM